MNIFYLHEDPVRSAQLHCDKHVVKMIIEYAQMLSTAHRMLDGTQYIDQSSGRRIKRWRLDNSNMDGVLYKASHINHPSAIWVRENAIQYQYMYDMFVALCDEYTYRYGKIHSTERLLGKLLETLPKNIKDNGFVEPPQAMPDYCKVPGDSIKAYQMYYVNEKIGFAKWTKRDIPTWFVKEAYAGFGEPAGYAS